MQNPMSNSDFLEFIETYKDNRFLWDKNHPNYSIKQMRNDALEVLLLIMKRSNPTANFYTVRKKVDHIRTSFNRERKKVINSQYVYKPNLWYYDRMLFLAENDPDQAGNDTWDDNEVETQRSIERSSPIQIKSGPSQIKSSPVSSPRKKVKHTRKRIQEKVEPVSQKKVKRISDRKSQQLSQESDDDYNNDEYAAFGKMVELGLKKLKHPEQSIAQKLISDVIFYSKLGKITIDSHISTPPSPIVVTEYSENSSQSDCNSPFITTSPSPPSRTPSPSSHAQITTTFLPSGSDSDHNSI